MKLNFFLIQSGESGVFWTIGNSQQTKQPKTDINQSELVNKERLTTFRKRRIFAFAYEKTNYRIKINM